MKNKKSLSFLILFLSSMVLITGRGHAAPAEQGANLLQNPSFEQPFSNGVANGWQRWFMTSPRQDEECLVAYHYEPKWIVETNPALVRDGSASQHVGNTWDTWAGGVFQTVPATPGTTYRFSFQGRARGGMDPYPQPSESTLQVNMRAGIDPNGGGSWSDGDVVWGMAGSPHDTWQEFSVEATATGDKITVFTSSNWAVTGVNQCRKFMDVWFDAGQLVAQTPPTNTPAPLPTLAPATQPPPTALPAPTGGVPTEAAAATVAATMTQAVVTDTPTPVNTATICVNAFLDANANGLRDADESFVAGVMLTVAQGTTVVGQAVSTGTETPICFSNLPAGAYQVGQTLSPTLEMTTQANATINVVEGQTVGLEFGSRLRPTPTTESQPGLTATAEAAAATPTVPATGGRDGGSNWIVYLGLGAVLIGVVLLGALLFMVLRR